MVFRIRLKQPGTLKIFSNQITEKGSYYYHNLFIQITEFFVNFKILRTSKGMDFSHEQRRPDLLRRIATPIGDTGLIRQGNPKVYWSVLKTRHKKEGSQLATNCSQLKMQSADGKIYKTDVEQFFWLIQSSSSDPFFKL